MLVTFAYPLAFRKIGRPGFDSPAKMIVYSGVTHDGNAVWQHRGLMMANERQKEDLRSIVQRELKLGRQAREQGNEGRARVCARRAAGWAVRFVYTPDSSESIPETNAYRYLLWLKQERRFPGNVREAAERLTARVNQEFSLPFDQDPLDDAALIVDWMLAKDE
jgi:hypothetical protein